MPTWYVVLLAVIQAITEFMPISSSGHLGLVGFFFGLPYQGLTFDLALHLGTLFAIVAYFWTRPADDWVARFLGMRNVVLDGDRAVVTRPEAVRVHPGRDAVVVSADRDGPLVRLRVRRDDGLELEAVATGDAHPRSGDRVAVEIDPAGVFEVPVWSGTQQVSD